MHPNETITSGKGVCSDLSCLYVAIGRKLGINVHYANVDKDFAGRPVHHACAIVELPGKGPLQVDPASQLFDVQHKSYQLMKVNLLEEITQPATVPDNAPNPEPEFQPGNIIPGQTPVPEYSPFAAVSRAIKSIAALALCAGIYYGAIALSHWYSHSNIQHTPGNGEACFTAKNSKTRFAFSEYASEYWKTALLFVEAKDGNLDDSNLLEKYVRADKNRDMNISLQEAQEACDAARDAYLNSRK